MLKNKLLKIFGIALFVCLITLMGKVNAMPECKLDGRTLTIQIKDPTNLLDAYIFANQHDGKFDHLIVKGFIHYMAFNSLEGIAKGCKSIDLSDLKIQTTNILPAGSFNQNDTVEKLVFPENMEIIQEQICWSCRKLKTVILPKNLKAIKDAVFQYCGVLNLKISKNIKTGKSVGQGSPGVILPNNSCTIL